MIINQADREPWIEKYFCVVRQGPSVIVKSMGRHIGEAEAGKSGFHLKGKEGYCSSKRILYLGYSGLKQDKWEWLKFLPGRLVSTT